MPGVREGSTIATARDVRPMPLLPAQAVSHRQRAVRTPAPAAAATQPSPSFPPADQRGDARRQKEARGWLRRQTSRLALARRGLLSGTAPARQPLPSCAAQPAAARRTTTTLSPRCRYMFTEQAEDTSARNHQPVSHAPSAYVAQRSVCLQNAPSSPSTNCPGLFFSSRREWGAIEQRNNAGIEVSTVTSPNTRLLLSGREMFSREAARIIGSVTGTVGTRQAVRRYEEK